MKRTPTELPCGTAFLARKPRSRRRGPLTQNQMDFIRVFEEERLARVIERDAKARSGGGGVAGAAGLEVRVLTTLGRDGRPWVSQDRGPAREARRPRLTLSLPANALPLPTARTNVERFATGLLPNRVARAHIGRHGTAG